MSPNSKSLSVHVSSVCSGESDRVASRSGSSAFTNVLSSVVELESEFSSRPKVPHHLGCPSNVLAEFQGSEVWYVT